MRGTDPSAVRCERGGGSPELGRNDSTGACDSNCVVAGELTDGAGDWREERLCHVKRAYDKHRIQRGRQSWGHDCEACVGRPKRASVDQVNRLVAR
jgi:hypothetical protein